MKRNVQVIDPRKEGHRPPKLTQPLFGEEALKRADRVLEAMSGSFEKWLDADLAQLQTARIEAGHSGWTAESLDTLWRAAHDLKGMGGTYGYPLVTQLAASLCRLIETELGKNAARANPDLVEAHVDALRAVVRDRIASEVHPVGAALTHALEEQVSRLGVAPR